MIDDVKQIFERFVSQTPSGSASRYGSLVKTMGMVGVVGAVALLVLNRK